MKLLVNGKDQELPQESPTVVDLLAKLGLTGRPVAVELNKELIRKREHATTVLRESDQIEVVTLVGGG
jgi:thiamine biosynthesis protein ThiS